MKHFFSLLFILGLIVNGQAQKYKFGKVSKAELSEKACPIDTAANACILYKKRYTVFDLEKGKGFVVKDEYYVRIKIYNKEGFDIATQSIPLFYTSFGSEEVMGLKAVTYNLENGKIKKTKLDKKNIYIEKTSDHYKQYKFSMPNLKPGSVIEWKYTKYSPFINELDDVVLQYDYPVKKEEIQIKIPEFYSYRPYVKGFLKVNLITDTEQKSISYTSKTRTGTVGFSNRETHYSQESFQFLENTYKIEMKNVPALKDEPFAGNIDNYRSEILFELIQIKYPDDAPKNFATTWEEVAKDAYLDSKFGLQLKKTKYLSSTIAPFKDMPNDTKKLIALFELAKEKIKWNGKYDYYVDKGVIKAFKTGTGNVAEVNLNLINMLNASGFEASPVLVSTLDHGIHLFPTRTGFNYVIAAVKINGKRYLLDATEKYTNLDVIPERTLNFEGRLIHKDGTSIPIDLYPKEYSNSVTNINLKLEDDELSGMSIGKYDKYFAYRLRKKFADMSKEDIEKTLQNDNEELEISKSRIKNLDNPYKPAMLALQFNTDAFTEEIGGKIYISPLLNKAITSNPFKSEERKFPVFKNFPFIRSVKINLSIPDNYEVVGLPENAVYNFGNNDGTYEYKIEQQDNKITIVSNYIIHKAVIDAVVYKDYKNFIDKVISKQKEKIILKKK